MPELRADTLREVICAGCGARFACDPAGPCWCAEETVRLPLPGAGGDCLCRDCLRAAARAQHDSSRQTF